MANTPQKAKDKNLDADALGAAQEAIADVRGSLRGVPEADRRREGVDADLFQDETAAEWTADAPVRRAANDDRAAIGKILQTLQRRPARWPYVVASLLGLTWLAGAAALATIYKGELQALILATDIGVPALIALVVAVIIPIAIFFALAHTVARAAELRVVAQTMAQVAMRFAEPETAARESIVNVGQAVRREVAAMGDGVERALARAAELEALVHNEVSALERAYNDNEVRIRDLLAELNAQRETLVSQADQVRSAINSVHLDLTHDISTIGDVVAEKVSDVAQRITRNITEKGEHITLALGHAGDSMIDALSERGSTLLDRLETTGDRATNAISSASDRLSASLNFKTDHVHDEFAELAARLQQMMTTRLDQVTQGFQQKSSAIVEQMASRSHEFTETLTNTGATLTEAITSRGEEVNSTLRKTGEALALDVSLRGTEVVSKMEQTGAQITETIVGRSDKVAQTFQDSAQTLANSIETQGSAIKDMLAARLQAFETMFNQSGTELTEKVARESGALGNLIVRNISEFDRTVKTYGGEIVERLGGRTEEVADAMKRYVDSFDERVAARGTEITASLEQRLTQFETVMGSHVTALADQLATGGKDVVAAIDRRIAETGSTITARGNEVADAIATKTAEIDTTLGAKALEVASTLDARVTRIAELGETIRSTASQAERSLTDLSTNTTEAIRTAAGDAERSLLGVSAEVARNFTAKSGEITAAVTAQAEQITTVLSEKSGGIIAAITDKGQEFAANITQATDTAVKTIEQKSFAYSQTMATNSEELARAITEAGATATGAVSKTLAELQDVTQSAIEQSRDTSKAAVTEMLETHGMLRSDSTAMFERLREANILLQEVLSGAHENMSALENTLMLRVSDFVTAMNRVSETTMAATSNVEQNIGDFRDVTSRVVTDLGQLTMQFDMHGRELARVAEMLDRSNRRTEDVVNERRVNLESLVSTLDIRTDDLDQRLKRFAGLLDESLEAAGTRAREIARVVSEANAESAHILADQFDRIRTAAEEERRRTSETMRGLTEQTSEGLQQIADQTNSTIRVLSDQTNNTMRTIFEQSTGDAQHMLHAATERFGEIMRSMKDMAAEMSRELEATRGELRRGVLEMPQETAESAAQMRRVLVDQIEALAELNRIVARHGRSLDTAEPVRYVSREENYAERRSEPTSRPAPRSEPAAFAPTRPRPAETSAPAASAASNPNNRGWLTELLNRASREEGDTARPSQGGESLRDNVSRDTRRDAAERTPRHSLESLDSLSVDIARMIDHDAAADLWDRYKRGERNVFTRRLYTLQGQKAFDEIRSKYRADREFKQTVDRYIAEFERLLDEVSRDDRGQVVARTYLTSETGKVYTMLAHAAGRFD
ncbi:MAG: hypothetical protein JOZ70_02930 [Pseudolabrys sp.]|nr:hypothetical protein [Pseudolabrys sp.]